MTRYVRRPRSIRPRCEWDEDVPLVPHLDVPDHKASFTGLLDANGEEIWREPRPVGFGRDRDW
jgi:hypothetical protein